MGFVLRVWVSSFDNRLRACQLVSDFLLLRPKLGVLFATLSGYCVVVGHLELVRLLLSCSLRGQFLLVVRKRLLVVERLQRLLLFRFY